MRFFRPFLVVLLSLLLGACSRSKSSPSLETRLVEKLPAQSFAFYSWGPLGELASNPSSATLNPLGRIEELEGTISGQVDQGSANLFKKIIASLKDANLIQNDGKVDPTLEMLFSVQKGNMPSTPDLTLFAKGGDKLDFRKLLSNLASNLGQSPSKDPSDSNLDTVKVSEGSANFYIHATQSAMSISTASEHWKSLFGTSKNTRYKELSESKNFKDSVEKLYAKGQRIALGYVDVGEAKSLVKDIQDSDTKESLEAVPFVSGTLVQQYDKGLITEGTFRVSPQNQDQKHLMDNLSGNVQTTLLEKLPSTSSLILLLDGRLIHTIYEGAIAAIDPGLQKEFASLFELVKKSRGLALNFGKPKADSPFPELSILLESESPELAMKYIIEDLHSILLGQNLVGGWMEKEIAGNKVKYVISPMGVGLFVTVAGPNLILSTTESATSATLESFKTSKGSLSATLQASSGQIFSPKPLFFAFARMSELAKTAEELQGTFSLFTGGASALNSEQVQQLKKLGDSALSVGIEGDFLIFRSAIPDLVHQ